MKNDPKASHASPEPRPDVAETYGNMITSFANLMHRNIERLAGLQRATLDMVSDQTADLTETVRSTYKFNTEFPPAALLDFTKQSVEDWIGVQKNIVDLMVEQSAQTVEATKVRADSTSKVLGALGDLVQQSTERTVAAQKAVADFAAKQNKTASDFIQKQAGAAGVPVAELAKAVEQGVGKVVNAQKEAIQTAADFAKSPAAHRV